MCFCSCLILAGIKPARFPPSAHSHFSSQSPLPLIFQVLGAMFRSIPDESTKVKSLLGGTLMAYQVPPPAPIQPISAEEEREEERLAKEEAKTISTTTAFAKNESLGDIQRRAASVISTSNASAPLNNNYVRKEQKYDREFDDTSQTPPLPPSSSVPSIECRSSTVNGDAVASCDKEDDDCINGYNPNENVNESSSQGSKLSNGISLEKAGDGTASLADGVSPSETKNGDNHVNACNDVITDDVKMVNDVKLENGEVDGESGPLSGFVVAVHRKILRMDVYFLSSQKSRPSLFGTPLLLPFYESTSQQELYASVWTQIARLVSPLPPSEASSPANHAQDCDDSLGYEYPFVLKRVRKDGYTCSVCPW